MGNQEGVFDSFDSSDFSREASAVNQSNEEQAPENFIPRDLRSFPLIKSPSCTYQPANVIGYGAFGYVIRVIETETKQDYAMKFFCLEINKPSKGEDGKELDKTLLTKEEQEDMIESGVKEFELLREFKDTKNIIKFKECFVAQRSPIEKKGKEKPYLCLIIEFCNGGNLNFFLERCERRKQKIPKFYSLVWFLQLLKTMDILHSKYKIIHRDLKPDNILFSLKDDEYHKDLVEVIDVKRIKTIKICDFGVGKVIRGGNLGRQVKGHLFYSAPEILKPTKMILIQKGYNELCDIFSLGLIFFHLVSSTSQGTYEKLIQSFRSKSNGKDINYFDLIVSVHERHILEKVILKASKDRAIVKVLSWMICGVEKRLDASKIWESDIVHTWRKILLTDPSYCTKNLETTIEENINPKKISYDALLTCLEIRNNLTVFENLLYLLSVKENEKKSQSDDKLFRLFLEKGALVKLFVRLTEYTDTSVAQRYEYLTKYMSKFLLNCSETKQNLKILSKSLRIRKDILGTMKLGLVKNKSDEIPSDLLRVIVRLCQMNRTFFLFVGDTFQPLLEGLGNCSRENEVLILKMLEKFLPSMKKVDINLLLFETQTVSLRGIRKKKMDVTESRKVAIISSLFHNERYPNSILILKNLPFRYSDKRVWLKITEFVISRLNVHISDQDVEGLKPLLELIIFYLFDMEKIKQRHKTVAKEKLRLLFTKRPPPGTGLLCKNPEDRTLIINTKISNRLFHYKGGSKINHVMVSSEPICKLVLEHKDECAIGYYEVLIKNGGVNDSVILGFKDEKKRRLLFDCSSGTMFFNNREMHKMDPLFCDKGTVVGIGITNWGRVFVTKDGVFFKPADIFSEEDRGIILHAIIQVDKENSDLGGYLNFGKREFLYKFMMSKTTEKEINNYLNNEIATVILRKQRLFKKCLKMCNSEKELENEVIGLINLILGCKNYFIKKQSDLFESFLADVFPKQ